MPARATFIIPSDHPQSLLSTDNALKGEELRVVLKNAAPEGLGWSHMLDTTPSVVVLAQCLEALQKNGQVMQVGVKSGRAKPELNTLNHMANARRLIKRY